MYVHVQIRLSNSFLVARFQFFWNVWIYKWWRAKRNFKFYDLFKTIKSVCICTRIQLSECNPRLDLTALRILHILEISHSIRKTTVVHNSIAQQISIIIAVSSTRTRIQPIFLPHFRNFETRITHFQQPPRNQPEITEEGDARQKSSKLALHAPEPGKEGGIYIPSKKKKKFTETVYIFLSPSPIIHEVLARSSRSPQRGSRSIVNLLLEEGINPPVAAVHDFISSSSSLLLFYPKILYMRGLGCREESVRNWGSPSEFLRLVGWLGG